MDLFPFGFLDRMHWIKTTPPCFANELGLDADVWRTEPGELLTLPALARNSVLGLSYSQSHFLGINSLRPASMARVIELDGRELMRQLAECPFARAMRWEKARDEFIRDAIQLSLHLKDHHSGEFLRLRTEDVQSVLYPAWETPLSPARQSAIRHA